MDVLWSASTTMRNPERMFQFLETLAEIEDEVWNHDMQCKYQILLIKNRYYKPTVENLPENLAALVTNYPHKMTFAEASEIFEKKKYVGTSIRGRTSFDPLEKLGLASLDKDNNNVKRVKITTFGKMFLEGKIDLGEVVFSNLLKIQFPNPLEKGRKDYNIKPFIGVLHLIKRVNELCEIKKIKAVGISKEEFGIFVLSLKSYLDINNVADRIVAFRIAKRKFKTEEKKAGFVQNFISDYLCNFQNPHKNIKEYTDNIIRYLRLTKYIYIRGGGYYIDLEPRRMIEINLIVAVDCGAAQNFTLDEYKKYIGDYDAYTLPFETVSSLTDIANGIIEESKAIAKYLGVEIKTIELPETSNKLKRTINKLREYRTELQNLKIRRDYQDLKNIDKVIGSLKSIHDLDMRPSIALEKWANIALNVLNDAVKIKPNAPYGDDNEPTFTAPAGVPDIECYYDNFGAICEVTMLTGRDQWYNEGQPVMRHLRLFEQTNNMTENYCLFVAPRLHTDTINTFWNAVKYEYEGKRQKIVPITITKLLEILSAVRKAKETRRSFKNEDIRQLYDKCIDISTVENSTKWSEHIGRVISIWSDSLVR